VAEARSRSLRDVETNTATIGSGGASAPYPMERASSPLQHGAPGPPQARHALGVIRSARDQQENLGDSERDPAISRAAERMGS